MDISEVKKQLTLLKEEVEANKKQSTEQRIDHLEKELNEMKERYISLLEHTIELKGNRKSEIDPKISKRNDNIPLDKFQLLVLLKQSRAITPEFAVSASQLQQAFSINKTTRTIRDKLTSLELMNLIVSIGQKPKIYCLTARGLQMIAQQERGVMELQ